MQVVVTGATGFIGRPLVQALREDGHEVTVLTREVAGAGKRLPAGVRAVAWSDAAAWEAALAAADAVINLAGESIAGGRWTAARKERIRRSRVESTRALVEAMARQERRPGVLINASAVGYYGPLGDEPVDESAPPGHDFLARVTVEWEQEARRAEALGVRVVLLRIGMVLGEDGGALAPMVLPFKLFVGGPVGSGRQWLPWVHREDVVGLIRFALANDQVRGPVNATATEAHTNASFSRLLGRVLGRPSWLPVPAFALRLLLGEMADLVLNGQKVVPAAAERYGYRFRFPALEPALRDVLGRRG